MLKIKLLTLAMFVYSIANNSPKPDTILRSDLSSVKIELSAYQKSILGANITLDSLKLELANKLGVPKPWIDAVMTSESGNDPNVLNTKGSGAFGLIQIMPKTARIFKTSAQEMKSKGLCFQFDIIYKYIEAAIRWRGKPHNLADFYLLIAYPTAANRNNLKHILYISGSKEYSKNKILDFGPKGEKDGVVRVIDFHYRMRQLFPKEYSYKL